MLHSSIRISLAAALCLPALAFGAPKQRADDQAQTRTSQTQVPAEQLSEAQVAGILATINKNEIDVGTLAMERGTGTQIKAFAQTLAKDHGVIVKKARDVNTQLGQEPRDSDKSQELSTTAMQEMETLQAARGLEFDKLFIDQQVACHEKLLAAIDAELLPAVQNDSFKLLLKEICTMEAGHLDMAKRIQADLANRD